MLDSKESIENNVSRPELIVPSPTRCLLCGQWPDDARWHRIGADLSLLPRCNLILFGPNDLALYARWNSSEGVIELIEFGDFYPFPNGTTAQVPIKVELRLPNTQVIITTHGLVYVQNGLFSDPRVSTLLLSLLMENEGRNPVSTH